MNHSALDGNSTIISMYSQHSVPAAARNRTRHMASLACAHSFSSTGLVSNSYKMERARRCNYFLGVTATGSRSRAIGSVDEPR